MHLPLVEHLARRFRNRGEPLDDLIQVATIGLIKSVDRFDPERGVEFSTYATPTIVGEIKRHFRDKGWAVRVPRRLQELRLALTTATAELSQQHGRSPTVARAGRAPAASPRRRSWRAWSRPTRTARCRWTSRTRRRRVARRSRTRSARRTRRWRASSTASRSSRCWSDLPPREKKILLLRFFGNMTQSQIAAGGRHLPDARLPAAGPHAGPAPREAPGRGVGAARAVRARLRRVRTLWPARGEALRASRGQSQGRSRSGTSDRQSPRRGAISADAAPCTRLQATGQAISWVMIAGAAAPAPRRSKSPRAASSAATATRVSASAISAVTPAARLADEALSAQVAAERDEHQACRHARRPRRRRSGAARA